MVFKLDAFHAAHGIEEDVEGAARGNSGVKLAQGTGGGIARIGERFAAFVQPAAVEFSQGLDLHIHFAADFRKSGYRLKNGFFNLQRYVGDGL